MPEITVVCWPIIWIIITLYNKIQLYACTFSHVSVQSDFVWIFFYGWMKVTLHFNSNFFIVNKMLLILWLLYCCTGLVHDFKAFLFFFFLGKAGSSWCPRTPGSRGLLYILSIFWPFRLRTNFQQSNPYDLASVTGVVIIILNFDPTRNRAFSWASELELGGLWV